MMESSQTIPAVAQDRSVWVIGAGTMGMGITPGFIVNRIARPYCGEALRLLQEGAGSPATLDAVYREGSESVHVSELGAGPAPHRICIEGRLGVAEPLLDRLHGAGRSGCRWCFRCCRTCNPPAAKTGTAPRHGFNGKFIVAPSGVCLNRSAADGRWHIPAFLTPDSIWAKCPNPHPAPCPRSPMQTPKATEFKLNIAADLHKWRAFVAIGELGSLTRAAIFLDSNQSLLSRQINALERECGLRLFNRTGRGVEFSDSGKTLFPQVKALLEAAEQLETDIRGGAREPTGRVTVGSLPSIANPLVGRLFTEIREHHPQVNLKVLEGSSGQVEEWLSDARVDIAILYRYGATVSEHEQVLATVDSYLIGPRGDTLTAASEVPFKALDRLPFILPSAPNGLRTALDAVARREHLNLAPVIEADSLPLQKLLVERERLYTVLPLHAVWTEVAEGRVQAAHIVNPPFQRTVVMATAKFKGPPRAVSAVASRIVDIVDDMARKGMWRSESASS